MKKLFILLAATLFMLTSCDIFFVEPEFVGSWTRTEDITDEVIAGVYADTGYLLTGITVESTMDLKLTIDTFEIMSTTSFSGDQSVLTMFELVDTTEKYAKGNLEYTESEVTLTATHYGDDETGQTWVAVSGEQADMGTSEWSVSGDTLTITGEQGSMTFTRK